MHVATQFGALEAEKMLVSRGNSRTIKIDDREMSIQPLAIHSKYKADLIENIGEYSSKIKYIIDYVTGPGKGHPIFIFTPLVSGTGGAIFIGLILELFGYSKAHGNTVKPDLRYALITGEDKSSLQRKKLIDIFNSPENRDASIIQIMIATKTISEGTSFINVRDEIIVSPFWNNSVTEQAIGRGIREFF